MLMWFLKRVEAEQEVAESSVGWGGRGVTWEAVRLLSHGSCFQAQQRRGRSFGVAVRSERPALDFHVAPSTSGGEASKQEKACDGDSSH